MGHSISAYIPHVTAEQVAPFGILALGAIVLLVLDAILRPERRDKILTVVTGAIMVAAGVTFYFNVLDSDGMPFFEGMLRADEFSNLGALVIVFASIAYLVLAPRFIRERKAPAGELYTLLVFCLFGLAMLCVANDLITAFICVEIVSLALYVMVGIDRRSRQAGEAAFKYFILGAFASAFLVAGIAFIFGATGTTQLKGHGEPSGVMSADLPNYEYSIAEVFASGHRVVTASVPATETVVDPDGSTRIVEGEEIVRLVEPVNPLWVYLGFALLLVGMSFKLSLAPFHMWAPDVYTGAPTITAMYIATASKVGAFAFLVHVIEAMSYWPVFSGTAGPLIAAVAVISMVWGNLGALVQTNIKRMLAYSSIAQVGYMILGMSFGTVTGLAATLLHLFNHAAIKAALFMAVGAIVLKKGIASIESVRGLGRDMPLTMAAFVAGGLSLIGVPLTVGFISKWYLIVAAFEAGMWFIPILIVASSLLAVIYIWRVVEAAYFQEAPDGKRTTEAPLSLLVPTYVLIAVNLYFGIDTSLTVSVATQGAEILMGTWR